MMRFLLTNKGEGYSFSPPEGREVSWRGLIVYFVVCGLVVLAFMVFGFLMGGRL